MSTPARLRCHSTEVAQAYPAVSYESNLTAWLREASAAEWQQGADWYEQAGAAVHAFALQYGIRFRDACAMVAVLSPMVRWERNILEAENVVLGRRSAAYPENVRKAAYILAGEDPDEIVSGEKVTAFYRLLLSDGYDVRHVCLDSIAILAALGIAPNPLVTSDDAAPVFNRPRQREVIRQAYRAVALRHDLRPCQAQAIVWTVWRNERDKDDYQHNSTLQSGNSNRRDGGIRGIRVSAGA